MQIACGGNHSMVLTIHGTLFAFGHNSHGQLGIYNITESPLPLSIHLIKYDIFFMYKELNTFISNI